MIIVASNMPATLRQRAGLARVMQHKYLTVPDGHEL